MRRRRVASSTRHAAWVTLCCACATLALAADPRDHADCRSCVAAGYDWSPTKGKCGGFKNKACPDPAPQPAACEMHARGPCSVSTWGCK